MLSCFLMFCALQVREHSTSACCASGLLMIDERWQTWAKESESSISNDESPTEYSCNLRRHRKTTCKTNGLTGRSLGHILWFFFRVTHECCAFGVLCSLS